MERISKRDNNNKVMSKIEERKRTHDFSESVECVGGSVNVIIWIVHLHTQKIEIYKQNKDNK